MPGPGPYGNKKPKKPKKGINPYYQNPDGSAKSEKVQQQQYVTAASKYSSSGTYVGAASTQAARQARRATARAQLNATRSRIDRLRRDQEKDSKSEAGVKSGAVQTASIGPLLNPNTTKAVGKVISNTAGNLWDAITGSDEPKKKRVPGIVRQAQQESQQAKGERSEAQRQLDRAAKVRPKLGKPPGINAGPKKIANWIAKPSRAYQRAGQRALTTNETALSKQRKIKEKKELVQLARDIGAPNNQPKFKGPSNQKEVNRWAQRAGKKILGGTNVDPSAGGRTPQEVLRGLQANNPSKNRDNISASNLEVAKGQWKKVGGAPKDLNTLLQQALPVDRRSPTKREFLQDEEMLKAYAIAIGRDSYDRAEKAGINEAKDHRNPWRLSDAQAPKNETAKEKFEREKEVLSGLLRRRPGSGLEIIDAFEQQRIRQDLNKEGTMSELLSFGAAKRVAGDVGKFAEFVSDADNPADFIGRLTSSQGNLLSGGTASLKSQKADREEPNYEADAGDYANLIITLSALKGIASGTKLAKAAILRESAKQGAEEGTKLGLRGGALSALTQTRGGRITEKLIRTMGSPTVRTTRQGVYRALVYGGAAESIYGGLNPDYDSQVNTIIKGTVQGNVPKALFTTTKSFLMAFTAPFVAVGNLGLTSRRLIDIGASAQFGLDGISTEGDIDYALNPLDRMITEWWQEIEVMADLYATGSVAEIRDATTNDYGYIALMGAAFGLRSLAAGNTLGVGKFLAQTPPSRKIAAELAKVKRKVSETDTAQRLRDFKETQSTIMRTGVATGLAENRKKELNGALENLDRQFNAAKSITGQSGKKLKLKLQEQGSKRGAQMDRAGLEPTDTYGPLDGASWFASRGLPVEKTTLDDLNKMADSVATTEGEKPLIEMLIQNPDMWSGNGKPARIFRDMVDVYRENDDILAEMQEKLYPRRSTSEARQIDRLDTNQERIAAETMATKAALEGTTPEVRPLTRVARDEKEARAERDRAYTEKERIDNRINEVEKKVGASKAHAATLWYGHDAAKARGPIFDEVISYDEQLTRLTIDEINATHEIKDIGEDLKQVEREIAELEKTGESPDYLKELESERTVLRVLRGRREEEAKKVRLNVAATRKQLTEARERAIAILDGKEPKTAQAMVELSRRSDELRGLSTAERLENAYRIRKLSEDIEGRLTPQDRAELGVLLEDDPEYDRLTARQKQGVIARETALALDRRIKFQMGLLQRVSAGLSSGRSFAELSRVYSDRLEEAERVLDERGAELAKRIENPIDYVDGIRMPTLVPDDVRAGLVRAQARVELQDLLDDRDAAAAEQRFIDSLRTERRGRAKQKGGDRPVVSTNPQSRRKIRKQVQKQIDVQHIKRARLARRYTEETLDRLNLLRETRLASLEQGAKAANKAAANYWKWRTYSDDYMEKYARALENEKLTRAVFIAHNEPDTGSPPVSGIEREPGNQTPKDKRSDMVLAERGNVDRTARAMAQTYMKAIEAEKNLNLTKWVIANGSYTAVLNGISRSSFRRDEFKALQKIYKKETGRNLFEDFVYIDKQFTTEPNNFGSFLQIDFTNSGYKVGRNVSKTARVTAKQMQDKIDEKQGDATNPPELTFLQPKGAEQLNALNEKLAAKAASAGREYIFVNRSVIIMMREQTKQLGQIEGWLYKLNRLSSRLVLGTSLSWMLAQPIAEVLMLVAQHPVTALPRLVEAAAIRSSDAEGLRLMATISRGTMGTDPAINRRNVDTTRSWSNAQINRWLGPKSQGKLATGLRFMRGTPGYGLLDANVRTNLQQIMVDTASMKSFGQFDQWKGAWIREAGLLAEMDSQVMGWRRAMKAVKGQFDIIEQNANRMAKMTRKEQLRFINSDEGIEVGMELARLIDDQMGNWTDLRPGIEQTVGNLIFFYPFLRFSLTWMLRTYPREHPVVWTTANLLGLANAQILEEYVQYDPIWPNEWAIAPLFGGAGEQSGPTSYIPVNRYSAGGNALNEMLLSQPQPEDAIYELAMRLLPPLATQVGFALLSKKDRYGNPIKDADDDIINPDPSAGTQAGFVIDNFLNLTAHWRLFNQGLADSGLNKTISFQNILDPSNDFDLYDNPGAALKERDPTGDDPNSVRSFLRQALIAGIPMPMNTVAGENEIRRLQDDYQKARATANVDYEFDGSKTITDPSGREVNFRAWVEDRIRWEDKVLEKRGRHPKRTEEVRQWVKHYIDLKRGAKYGSAQEKKARLALYRGYQALGEFIPDFLKEDIRQEDQDNRRGLKIDFVEEFPDAPWPGHDKAKRLLGIASSEGRAVGNMKVKTPRASANLTSGKATQKRINVTAELRQATRGRLADEGMVRVDLSDPTLDPETKVGKNGIVRSYRGYQVVGNQTIAELKKSEDKGWLELDGKGRITTPGIRKVIANVENKAADVTEIRRKLTKARTKAGGRIELDDSDETIFINTLASVTGLDARVLAAWTRQEGGNERQDYNRLNIGWTGSGPNSATNNPAWTHSPRQAALTTIDFINGKWGGAGAAIPQIISRARGKSAQEQIRIISESGWRLGSEGPDPEYTQNITNVYNDLPPVKPANPAAKKQLKGLQAQLDAAKKTQAQAVKQAEKLGIPIDTALYDEATVRTLDEPTLWKQPTRPGIGGNKINPGFEGVLKDTPGMSPLWDGTNKEILRLGKTISKWVGEPIGVNSLNRPGDVGSDHGVGNAIDINAIAQREGGSVADERRGDRIAAAAVLAVGGTQDDVNSIVAGNAITINSPNGYRVQIIWKSDVGGNHFNHVHVGIAPSGDIVKPFSKTGLTVPYSPSSAGSVSSSGGSISGGGGVSGGGTPGTGNLTPEQAVQQSIKKIRGLKMGGEGQDYEDAGVDPGVTAVAEASEKSASGDGVKSVTEQMASLPSIGSKKKKVPRFPANPI